MKHVPQSNSDFKSPPNFPSERVRWIARRYGIPIATATTIDDLAFGRSRFRRRPYRHNALREVDAHVAFDASDAKVGTAHGDPRAVHIDGEGFSVLDVTDLRLDAADKKGQNQRGARMFHLDAGTRFELPGHARSAVVHEQRGNVLGFDHIGQGECLAGLG